MTINAKYTATAVVTGGREGHARTLDGTLDLQLSTPAALGGQGGSGTNPEQLFAAGYAACFLSALRMVGQKTGVTVPSDAVVSTEVGIGANDSGGFGLVVALAAALPGLAPEASQQLIAAAHQVCPYSNAIRDNVEVSLRVVDIAEFSL